MTSAKESKQYTHPGEGGAGAPMTSENISIQLGSIIIVVMSSVFWKFMKKKIEFFYRSYNMYLLLCNSHTV